MKYTSFRKIIKPYKLSSSEFIESEKGGYLNVWKTVYQGTLRQSMYQRVPNTAEIFTAVLLFFSSNTLGYIELGNCSLSQI